MIACDRGDVILVGFVFADESGKKRRPAVVVSSPDYLRARREVVVAAITSNVRRRFFGDHTIVNWKEAGLLFPSVATGILRTIKQAMIERRLGAVKQADLDMIVQQLRRSLGL